MAGLYVGGFKQGQRAFVVPKALRWDIPSFSECRVLTDDRVEVHNQWGFPIEFHSVTTRHIMDLDEAEMYYVARKRTERNKEKRA